jgi:hypothetical protein
MCRHANTTSRSANITRNSAKCEMRSMYIAIRKAGAAAAPWLSSMMKVEVAEPEEEDANRRGRT